VRPVEPIDEPAEPIRACVAAAVARRIAHAPLLLARIHSARVRARRDAVAEASRRATEPDPAPSVSPPRQAREGVHAAPPEGRIKVTTSSEGPRTAGGPDRGRRTAGGLDQGHHAARGPYRVLRTVGG